MYSSVLYYVYIIISRFGPLSRFGGGEARLNNLSSVRLTCNKRRLVSVLCRTIFHHRLVQILCVLSFLFSKMLNIDKDVNIVSFRRTVE